RGRNVTGVQTCALPIYSSLILLENIKNKRRTIINKLNDKEQEVNIDLSNNDLLQIFDIPSLNSILINTYNYDSQKYELSLINKVSKREEILFQSKRNIVSINDLS